MENAKRKRGRPPKRKAMEFEGMTYEGAINNALDKEVAATASNINLKDSEEDIREAIDKYDFACTCYKAADKMYKSISTLETTELE